MRTSLELRARQPKHGRLTGMRPYGTFFLLPLLWGGNFDAAGSIGSPAIVRGGLRSLLPSHRDYIHRGRRCPFELQRQSSGIIFQNCVKLKIGGRDRDRTCDLIHAMDALSQLSYTPVPEQNELRMVWRTSIILTNISMKFHLD